MHHAHYIHICLGPVKKSKRDKEREAAEAKRRSVCSILLHTASAHRRIQKERKKSTPPKPMPNILIPLTQRVLQKTKKVDWALSKQEAEKSYTLHTLAASVNSIA